MSLKNYSKNNLNQVIFQIKFYPLLKLYSDKPEVASDFQQIIIKEFPKSTLKQNRKVNLKIDSTGLPVEGSTNKSHLIWNFNNENGKFIVLSGDELTLVYPGNIYTSFNVFLNDIKLAIKGLKIYNIPQIKSIGLRYINQIKINNETQLKKYINPDLHLTKQISDNEEIIQSIAKIEYKINEFLLSFQYGLFNPKYPELNKKKDFILDYDCILNKVVSIDKIDKCLIKMNEIIYNKFENSIKDELRNKMKED